MAQAELDAPDESFSVLELPDPQELKELTFSGEKEEPEPTGSTLLSVDEEKKVIETPSNSTGKCSASSCSSPIQLVSF